MKKYILSIMVIAIMAGIYSCKKNSANQPSAQEDEMMVRSKKVISLIKQFDAKMNSTLKAGETIELDSAVWNMEALQNYDYAYPDSAAKDFEMFKSYYTIPIDANGMVLVSDVQVVNEQMEDTLLYYLDQIESEIKHMRFADVVLDSAVGSTGYLSVTNGFGFNLLLGTYWAFEDDDDWYWGTLSQEYGQPPLGKCDGTQVGVSDGSDELQWRLNNPVVGYGGPYIFTDVVTLLTNGFCFLDDNDDPRLYVGWNYPEENCLTDDLLTYYLIQSDDIINTYDYEGGLRPPGLYFSSVYINDDLMMASSGDKHYHYYEVTYGTITMLPPGE